jgi:hypothetical protein
LAGEARHTKAATISAGEVADLRKQLDAVDSELAAARAAAVKAGSNRDRARAAQAVADKAQAERDRIAGKLREATQAQAQAQAGVFELRS